MENYCSLDCELVPDNDLCASVEDDEAINASVDNVTIVNREYTGIDTNDIDVTVDNVNYTISAVLTNERREQLDNIPEKTSDLTNDGEDGTSPFATQEYVEENGGKIDSISVNGTPQTIDADKNVDIDVPTALSDLTNDANFVQDASYVHTDNNYTTEEKNKLSGVQNGAQVNAIEHIAVDGVEQTITDKSVNIDLTGKQDVLTAGDNIDITNNEISAKDVVTTNTNQEITSDKTFDCGNRASFEVANGNKYGLSGSQYNYLQVDYNGVGMYSFGTQQIFPNSNNSRDLGTSGLKWRNFFVQGNLSDGTNSVSVQDIADNISATAQNASDISDLDNNKVDKTSTANRLYGTNSNGEQTTVGWTQGVAGSYIVQRDGAGQIYVALLPTADNNAASKKYVDDRFNGASKTVAYSDYSVLVEAVKLLGEEAYNVGQNIYVVTTGVPDLWVSAISSEFEDYTYTTDEALVEQLKEDGYVQIGYYKFSELETQKVDLTDYVTNTQLEQELAVKADDADVVHTTGDENIGGTKTFLGQQRFKKASEGGGYFYISPDGNGYNAKIGFSSGGQMMIHNGGFQIDRNLYPMTANSNLDLGTSSALWNDLHLKGNLKDNNGNTITIADIANKAALAPAYDSTATYEVGDVVVYGKKLYICSTAVETAEAFDDTKWTEITVDSNYVDKTTAETITGEKTIKDTDLSFSKSGASGNASWQLEEDIYGQLAISRTYNGTKSRMAQFNGNNFLPEGNNGNLGSSSKKWQDLHLSRNLTDGTNSIAVADIANKTDILLKPLTLSTTTMTDEQIATLRAYNCVLTNDLTLGNTSLKAGTILTVPFEYSNSLRGMAIYNNKIMTYYINLTTKVIGDGAQDIVISNVADIKTGKVTIDNYTINKDSFGQLQIGNNNATSMQFDGGTVRAQNLVPIGNNSKDLGSSNQKWKDGYFAGVLSDGTNSISIAKIQDSDKALQKISDHENFAGVTGDQAYKCIGGATINGWFAIGGVQRECLYINLTAYSGTTYRFWGIFRNSSDNKYVNLQGTVSGVESGSSTNVTWTVSKTIDIDSEKQDKLTAGTNITIDENNVISASGGNEKEIVELSIVGSAETYTYTDEEQQSQTLHFLCFDIDDTDWAKLTDKVTVKLSLSYTPQVGDDISDGMFVTHNFSSWSGIPSELNVLTFDLNNDYEIAENEWFVEGTVIYFDIGETDPAKGLFTTYGMIDGKIEQISVPTKTSDLTNDGDGTSNFATMADLPTVPTNVSAFTNDAGYLTSYTETDPTVPSWAKASSKPTYSYSEITNTPDLSNFITNTVNDLTNYYLKSETYTQTEIDNRISAIPKFNIQVVSSLPVTDISETTLYLIPNSGSGTNVYDEYIYVNNGTEQSPSYVWEKLGTQTVDLSGYVQTSRKINNHALTADITLTADDIGIASTDVTITEVD